MPTAKQRKAEAHARAQKAKTAPQHAFRQAEQYWKSKLDPPDLDQAFQAKHVEWTSLRSGTWRERAIRKVVVGFDQDGNQEGLLFEDLPGEPLSLYHQRKADRGWQVLYICLQCCLPSDNEIWLEAAYTKAQ